MRLPTLNSFGPILRSDKFSSEQLNALASVEEVALECWETSDDYFLDRVTDARYNAYLDWWESVHGGVQRDDYYYTDALDARYYKHFAVKAHGTYCFCTDCCEGQGSDSDFEFGDYDDWLRAFPHLLAA